LAVAAHPVEQYEPPDGALSRGVMGMYVFIASEIMFFGTLFGTYYYLFGSYGTWPPHGFEIVNYWPVPVINTFLLVGSSATFMLGERAILEGNRALFVMWLVVTILLGVGFEAGQAVEFWRADVFKNFHSTAFASVFFTMTGFHGAHVLGGLVLISILVWRAVRFGQFSPVHHVGVRAVGIYWHFVDVVWLFLLSNLYLVPNLFLK
jgi:heme/copper-type cytochrome/quinol oxidase subunit 3